MQFLPNIALLAVYFDVFIVDLWGVIHDGRYPYPMVKECLEALKAHGKKIIFLSNAPRRAQTVAAALLRMEINNNLYDNLVTSGEVFYQSLAYPEKGFFKPAGKCYFYMGLERDRNILEGLRYEEVKQPEKADFILLSHSYYDNQQKSELTPVLQRCLARRLPVLCINPDKEVVRQNGEVTYCAGVIAEEYRLMGGEVVYFGKPYPIVYEACLRDLAGTDKAKVVAIGDSLTNDIAGAAGMGIKSVLVTGGLLKSDVGTPNEKDYEEKVKTALKQTPARPDFAVPVFNWN